MDEKKWLWIIIFVFVISQAIFIKVTPFVADWNTYSHFYYSEGTSHNFNLYFDQWGKPLFTLVTSQFAQAGLAVYRLSTLLMGALSIVITFYICKFLNQKYPLIPSLFVGFSPLSYYLFSDGNTGALAILLILLGIYLFLKRRFSWSAIMMSLLFFVRTDSVVIIGVWGLIYLFRRKWKAIPWFAYPIGLFSALTWFLFKDPIYFMTHSPYLSSWVGVYPSGDFFWFIKNLFIASGPLPLLLFIPALTNLRKRYFLVIPPICLLLFHSVIYSIGRFGAAIDYRFFGMALPFIFLGYSQFFEKQTRTKYKLLILFFMSLITFYLSFTLMGKGINWNQSNLVAILLFLGIFCIAYILFTRRINPFPITFIIVIISLLFFNVYSCGSRLEDKYAIIACDNVIEMGSKDTTFFHSTPFMQYYLEKKMNKKPASFGLCLDSFNYLKKNSIILYDTHVGPNELQIPIKYIESHPRLKKVFEVIPDPPFKTLNGYDFKVMVFEVVE